MAFTRHTVFLVQLLQMEEELATGTNCEVKVGFVPRCCRSQLWARELGQGVEVETEDN